MTRIDEFKYDLFGSEEFKNLTAKVASLPGASVIRVITRNGIYEIEKSQWASNHYSPSQLMNARIQP